MRFGHGSWVAVFALVGMVQCGCVCACARRGGACSVCRVCASTGGAVLQGGSVAWVRVGGGALLGGTHGVHRERG